MSSLYDEIPSVGRNSDPIEYKEAQRWIEYNGRQVQVGVITVERGIYQVIKEPDIQAGQKVVEDLMSRARKIGLEFGVNLVNVPEQEGFKGVCWNPEKKQYFAIRVLPIFGGMRNDTRLQRLVDVFFSDGSQIQVTVYYSLETDSDECTLSAPHIINVQTKGYRIQQFTGSQRVYGEQASDVSNAQGLYETAAPLLNIIDGTKVDPFDILYGKMTDEELVRKFLGDRAVIDTKSGVVMVRIPEDKQPNYNVESQGNHLTVKEHKLKDLARDVRSELRKGVEEEDKYPLYALPIKLAEVPVS